MSDETRMTLLHSSTNDLVEELLMWRGRAAELLDRIAELENELEGKRVFTDTLFYDIYRLQSRIAELEAERRWIPVSERLPEENKCVLVYDAGGNMTVDFLVTSGEVEKYFWLAKYRILFWMPLPESPNDTQTQAIVYGKESD